MNSGKRGKIHFHYPIALGFDGPPEKEKGILTSCKYSFGVGDLETLV
jgi:hypothetical protein